MKLGDWIKKAGLTHEEMAERVGCDTSTITRLIPRAGKSQMRQPSFHLVARIKDATGGEVTANDFLPEVEPCASVKPEDAPQSAA